MKILRRTQFGNPILRTPARRLSQQEISTTEVQGLIANMRYSLEKLQYGVGLAAPQVGKSYALTVIGIKPTPTRKNTPPLNMVVINPVILKVYGSKQPMWEGCLSFGDSKNFPYALVPRYEKIRLSWLDEQGKEHESDFIGTAAHVLQHEVDHLNGVLFVDLVQDTTSYMTIDEYKRRHRPKKSIE